MKIQSFFTMPLGDQDGQAIHMHHLLYMQSLYTHHGKRLPTTYWQHQGKYQYSDLLKRLLEQDGISNILIQSEIIFLVYGSHEYNPREHLAGIIKQRLPGQRLITDILDCGQEGMAVAIMLAKEAHGTGKQCSIVCLEQKTEHPWRATRHDSIHNSVSILSTIPSRRYTCGIQVKQVTYDAWDRWNPSDLPFTPTHRTMCLSNRLDVLDSLPKHQPQHLLLHGHTDLMRQIDQFKQTKSPADQWITLGAPDAPSGYCIWLTTGSAGRTH